MRRIKRTLTVVILAASLLASTGLPLTLGQVLPHAAPAYAIGLIAQDG